MSLGSDRLRCAAATSRAPRTRYTITRRRAASRRLPERGASGSSSVLELGGDLGREIGRRPVDSLAQGEADEAGDPDRRARTPWPPPRSPCRLRRLAVDRRRSARAARSPRRTCAAGPRPSCRRSSSDLPRGARLLAQHVALAVERRGIDRGDVEILRVGGGDMHRQLRAQGRRAVLARRRLERDQHADLAETGRERIVHVGGDDAAARPRAGRRGAAPCSRRSVAIRWVSSSATVRPVPGRARPSAPRDRRRSVASASRQRRDEVLEQLVAGDKIGLGIDLDDGAGVAAHVATPTSPSAATRPAFLAAAARPFLRSQSTAASRSPAVSLERALAIHHAGAGLVAQLLDQRGGDLGHVRILSF